jgi:hypothetical protein
VLLVFGSAGERQLEAAQMSVGILSASQGRYSPTQLMLDIGQGARIASSAYSAQEPPFLQPRALPGGGGTIVGWDAVRRRAASAPQLLEPGLLAALAGGAGYVGPYPDRPGLGAIAAADRGGRIAAVSLGPRATVVGRAQAMLARERLVVTDLPEGAAGVADLEALRRTRRRGELMIAVQRMPTGRAGQLLWAGLIGPPPPAPAALGGSHVLGTLELVRSAELTSPSTNERGLVVSVDIAPTILIHLGHRASALPEAIRGKSIEQTGTLDGPELRSLMGRLHVVGPRRLKALGFLLLGWVLLLLACAKRPDRRAWAMRVGGLAVLWAPVPVLATAALEPSAPLEYAAIAISCLALGALADRLLPWPRAPIAPAVTAVVAITADALAHTQLLVRSLLGPNPILGARFYGIGNELKSALAVLVLAAVAGALHRARRGRAAALAFAGAGATLAAIEGSARIGAGVGGVILVSAGFAVAAIAMLPGALTRRHALIVLLSPLVALVALAAIDLLTAHGSGHYTGSVLHARSAGELRDVIVRRYKAAWGELRNHGMPVATALALACGALGLRRRARLLAPIDGDPVFQAAFAGGLTAAIVGALAEDSGPVLLVVGAFALGCLASYLWGVTPPARGPGRRRAARSRALRPPAERVS